MSNHVFPRQPLSLEEALNSGAWPIEFPRDPGREKILPVEVRGRIYLRAHNFFADHGFPGFLQLYSAIHPSKIDISLLFSKEEIQFLNKFK